MKDSSEHKEELLKEWERYVEELMKTRHDLEQKEWMYTTITNEYENLKS